MKTRIEFLATTMAAAASLTNNSDQASATLRGFSIAADSGRKDTEFKDSTPGGQDMIDKAEDPRVTRARLSGPEHVTKDATVAEMAADGNMTVLVKGTNEWVCTPGNENKIGDPPMCMNPMGMRWMMDAMQGKPKPTNTAPGMIYMLCGATQRSNTNPKDRTSPAIPVLTATAPHMIAPKRCRHGFTAACALQLALFLSPAFTDGQQHHTGDVMKTSTNSSPWTQEHHPTATQTDVWFENYRFRDGESLAGLRLHYATLGSPHRDAQGKIDNAVLVIHWTGADGNTLLSKNYMDALFAPGRPLDATRYFLIFPDNVGHGKSSRPSDGLKAKFPKYDYADMVDLQHRLVTETLGIEHLHAILGMSMGGMNAWQWAEAYPNAMDGIMPVVSMPIPISGRNMLWRRMVIDAIRSDPQWDGGNYTSPPQGWLSAFPLMRMMLDGVPHLQVVVPDGPAADRFIAEAQSQAAGVDANDMLYSLSSSADYDPRPGLAAIKAKVYALNFADDEFNPTELHVLEELMPKVREGRFVVQPGSAESFGHLTMAHPELWSEHVAEFMQSLGDEALQSSIVN